jgi:hypothetical protein
MRQLGSSDHPSTTSPLWSLLLWSLQFVRLVWNSATSLQPQLFPLVIQIKFSLLFSSLGRIVASRCNIMEIQSLVGAIVLRLGRVYVVMCISDVVYLYVSLNTTLT